MSVDIRLPYRSAVAVLVSGLGLAFATRALADAGELDPTFSGDGTALLTYPHTSFLSADAMAVQPDSKLVIAGTAGVPRHFGIPFLLERINPDGTLDTTFSGDGRRAIFPRRSECETGDTYPALAIDPTGKIVVGGFSCGGPLGNRLKYWLARLNPDGSYDTSFASNGRLAVPVGRVDLQGSADVGLAVGSDGSILMVGTPKNDPLAIRVTPRGALDRRFSGDGRARIDFERRAVFASAPVLAPDGKLLLAGSVDSARSAFAAARLDRDGRPDRSFSGDGRVVTRFGNHAATAASVAVQRSGAIVVGGAAGGLKRPGFALVRLTNRGHLDRGFSRDGRKVEPIGYASGIRAIALEGGGRIVAAGETGRRGAIQTDWALARFLPNGKPDPSFGSGGTVVASFRRGHRSLGDDVAGVTLTSDDRILVAGTANPRDDRFRFAAARYLTR